MEIMLNIKLTSPEKKISYSDNILLIGSCFTEEIGNRMKELKFSVLQNPNGILYDPLSISNSLFSYINNKQYTSDELFYLNELWQSWQHHSVFSGIDQNDVLQKINNAQTTAHEFLKTASWLIITFGSSYSYQLISSGHTVANCHKAPAYNFKKSLIKTQVIIDRLSYVIQELQAFNPELNIILTISPVRHIKDGVVQNNQSKARLIEAVHELTASLQNATYFPAYELIIDILRDYRFYEADMVHPTPMAIEYVLEKFFETYFEKNDQLITKEIKKINAAKNHRPFQVGTDAHVIFKHAQLKKVRDLQALYTYINFDDETAYFSQD
jgi:lysophospholipase L1-like esterase